MTDPRKVLVVDDVAGWCQQLAALLREGGFEVVTATDKQSALAELDVHRFDATVIDIGLGDSPHNVDGLLLNKHIQSQELNTQVILISARNLSTRELSSIRPATFLTKSSIIQRGESIVEAVQTALEPSTGDTEQWCSES